MSSQITRRRENQLLCDIVYLVQKLVEKKQLNLFEVLHEITAIPLCSELTTITEADLKLQYQKYKNRCIELNTTYECGQESLQLELHHLEMLAAVVGRVDPRQVNQSSSPSAG